MTISCYCVDPQAPHEPSNWMGPSNGTVVARMSTNAIRFSENNGSTSPGALQPPWREGETSFQSLLAFSIVNANSSGLRFPSIARLSPTSRPPLLFWRQHQEEGGQGQRTGSRLHLSSEEEGQGEDAEGRLSSFTLASVLQRNDARRTSHAGSSSRQNEQEFLCGILDLVLAELEENNDPLFDDEVAPVLGTTCLEEGTTEDTVNIREGPSTDLTIPEVQPPDSRRSRNFSILGKRGAKRTHQEQQ